MSTVLKAYNSFLRIPMGKALFSKMVCFKAPYFGTIKPRFVELRPGYGEIIMKKRRAVHNHLGSVHALAMGNMCELVAGTTLDATLADRLRWIPRSMNIEYLKIAKTDLRAVCKINSTEFPEKELFPVEVSVVNTGGEKVVHAVINMYITAKNRHA